MRPLILVGGGGHCKSAIETVESKGLVIGGILNLPGNTGEWVLNYPVIGTDNGTSHLVSDFDFIVTLDFIRAPLLRTRLHERIKVAGGRFATVIASTAHVSQHATVQYGTVILHHACINAGVSIGKGCIINTFANIEHDALIGDYYHTSTGVMVNGNCCIGRHTFLGSQSVMANGTEIVVGCVIAAGTVIRKDILYKGVYLGNSALLEIKL